MVGRWNFLLGWPICRGYVSFREGSSPAKVLNCWLQLASVWTTITAIQACRRACGIVVSSPESIKCLDRCSVVWKMYFKHVYFDQFLAYPCQILWVQFLQEVVLYPGFYALRTNHGKHQRLPTNAMVSFGTPWASGLCCWSLLNNFMDWQVPIFPCWRQARWWRGDFCGGVNKVADLSP